ncbi:mechanosensitive ion channel family protein [Candidatus Woesearchaeota archaeon]|nr:mechanosensitive ion channel family protein [Candidatus Woesearchaeota archaeon]MCF7901405.1 mechanosensitive ion channel family protein [Candidatus Woesearchaeota archaeon]MCF8013721.1 mechanosensitive ion channel family protein [Candidatus Woesearchaeota archaeon]
MKIKFLTISIILTIISWFISIQYKFQIYTNIYFSLLTITATYLFLKIIIENMILKKIKNSKSKYSFKKIILILNYLISLSILSFIWINNINSLLIAYGILTAGIALALQDVFKNFIGGIIIFVSKPFKIGDRIEINSKCGDILDIGLLYTSILEIKEWIKGDQATGRIVKIPNSYILTYSTSNYTEDHEFIWDEFYIPLTYNSNWKKIQDKIIKIITKETKEIMINAEKEITNLEEKYYLEKRPTQPAIYMTLTDNWIGLTVRYITKTRNRRTIHSNISKLILDEIHKHKDVKIASQTIDIVGMPKARK